MTLLLESVSNFYYRQFWAPSIFVPVRSAARYRSSLPSFGATGGALWAAINTSCAYWQWCAVHKRWHL